MHIHLGFFLISWSCKQQQIVYLLTFDAKYEGAMNNGIDLIWNCNLMGELGFLHIEPNILYCENLSEI